MTSGRKNSQAEEIGATQSIPDLRHDLRVLRALRRIVRFTEIHSRFLASNFQVTGPQLVCLLTIESKESVTASEIARSIFVSPSTVVGIIDRLEEKGFVHRIRSESDRRVVHISLTEQGRDLLKNAPSPLQDRLFSALRQLPEEEQATLAVALERVVTLMDAETVDASPLVEAGPLDQSVESKIKVSQLEENEDL